MPFLFLRRLGAFCAVSLLLPVTSFLPAGAEPSKAYYEAELSRLGTQISQLDEEYNYARVRLNDLKNEIRDIQHGKKDADERLTILRKAASARAAATYRTGLPGIFLIFFGSTNSSDFNRKMKAASKVGDWESGLMSELEIANQRAEQKSQDLRASLSAAKKLASSIDVKRGSLKDRQQEQQSLLARLEAAQLAEAQRKAAAAVRRNPAARVVVPTIEGIRAKPPVAAIPESLPASGGGSKAVRAGMALQGKPYKWGGEGPDSFDCSGFTLTAWRAAGVSLPHSSRAQYAATRRVAREDLQPGDLVFFGSPIHHVGIYTGGTSMVDSPSSGGFVGVRNMARRDYVGAGRPGA